ncbi:hypothetical protein Pmani_003189 [Petrolisthes manimaculis]|uniref:Uncharacterized protein n=1 Tax=Petrolisthes manimaculis TaxID=1843537 RepID=A0AAE1QJG0_9EUCA|nr:hypothetical protein Pmani_003189 [Petrolisthes manimaculis]
MRDPHCQAAHASCFRLFVSDSLSRVISDDESAEAGCALAWLLINPGYLIYFQDSDGDYCYGVLVVNGRWRKLLLRDPKLLYGNIQVRVAAEEASNKIGDFLHAG